MAGEGWDIKTKYVSQQRANELYEDLYRDSSGALPLTERAQSILRARPQTELLSVVIPVYRDYEATYQCLASLIRNTHRPYEVIIVDNAADGECKRVIDAFERKYAHIIVVRNPENVGYPVACNQGLAIARGKYLVVMNNDVIVTPYWASRLIAAFEADAKIGAVGPRTNFAIGPQLVEVPTYGPGSLDRWAEEWHCANKGSLHFTNRLIGFLLVMRRELVERIGGFDPLFGPGNFEDDDFSLRTLLAGYKLVIANDVFVHHHGSRSFMRRREWYAKLLDTNGRLFAAKWGIRFEGGHYNIAPVLGRGQYSEGDLTIPLFWETLFSPSLEPLDTVDSAPYRLLCIPDPSDSDDEWVRVIQSYLQHVKPDDGVTLIVRTEPAEAEWVQYVIESIRKAAQAIGVDIDQRDDIVIEARDIPSSERGRLYRTANAFLPLPGVRREALTREAKACGLAIIERTEKLNWLHAVKASVTTLAESEPRSEERVRVIQREWLARLHSPATESLIVILVPGQDAIGGGVLSIASIYDETRKLATSLNAQVVLCTVPGEPLLFGYTSVPKVRPVFNLPDVLHYFRRLQRFLLHIPEYAVRKVLSYLKVEGWSLLRGIERVHLNVMIQNIRLVEFDAIRQIKDFGTLTCTTAHEAYSTVEVATKLSCPLHKLSVYVSPEQYYRAGYGEKEDVLVVSPDYHPGRALLLQAIREALPGLRIQVVHGLPYEEYKALIRRAKWTLTLGEGLDGYFVESVFSGGIAFAIYNGLFFTEDFKNLRTVYPSFEAMLTRMCKDLQGLDSKDSYSAYQDLQYRLCARHYNYSAYVENLRGFYLKYFSV